MKRIYYSLIGCLLLLLAACEKDTLPMQFAPGVTTGNATDIYRKGAVLSGSIQLDGDATAKTYGILFSELESMAEYTEYVVTDNTKDFSVRFSNLTPGTTYYYCAFANSGYSLAKGQVKSFTTPDSNAPVFAEIALMEKDEFSCKASATLLDEGGSTISLSGFCWTKAGEGEPTTDSSVLNAHVENGIISVIIEGLEPATEYQIRAYATNANGVGYSQTLLVKTSEATTPILSAITEKESSNFSVTVEAQITDAGTSAVYKAGFCWSTTNQTPTVGDSSNDLTAQLDETNTTLSTALTDLAPSTIYYIRAYATNEQGTAYSEVFTFTTAEAKAPVLSAITEKESSNFSITVEAQITDAGTSAVSKAGFCWSTTNQTPSVGDSSNDLTVQLTGTNTTLSAALADLAPGTTYYIRAYATNEQGTAYSEVFTFTTAEAKTPVLSAITQKESTDTSLTVEVQLTDTGTSAVTMAGFCWSTNSKPTVSDSHIDATNQLDGTNTTLNATLKDLKPGTTYYIRAYATNGEGTTYSEAFTYITPYADTGDGSTEFENLPTTEWE